MRDPLPDLLTVAVAGLVVLGAGLFVVSRRAKAATPDASISPGLARAFAPSWISASGSPDAVSGNVQAVTKSSGPLYETNSGDLLPGDLVVPDGRGGFVNLV